MGRCSPIRAIDKRHTPLRRTAATSRTWGHAQAGKHEQHAFDRDSAITALVTSGSPLAVVCGWPIVTIGTCVTEGRLSNAGQISMWPGKDTAPPRFPRIQDFGRSRSAVAPHRLPDSLEVSPRPRSAARLIHQRDAVCHGVRKADNMAEFPAVIGTSGEKDRAA